MSSGDISIKEQLQSFYDDLPPWGKAAALGCIAIAAYIPYKYITSLPRKSPIKTDFEKDVVYLYQFPRMKNIPSISPFCLKLETWLRMAEIQYENVPCGFQTRSSEGTLPFIEYNGKEYPDSSLAIRDMTKILSKEGMESPSPEIKSAARAFESLAEYSLLGSIAVIRYTEFVNEMFNQLPEGSFGIFHPFIVWLLKQGVTSKVLPMLKVLGIAKHSREEILNIGFDDLKAFSTYIGSKHYLTGFKPTRADATLFGVLAQIIYAPYDLPHKKYINENCPNLIEYCERIKNRFWTDWEECTTKFSLNTKWNKRRTTNQITLNTNSPQSISDSTNQ